MTRKRPPKKKAATPRPSAPGQSRTAPQSRPAAAPESERRTAKETATPGRSAGHAAAPRPSNGRGGGAARGKAEPTAERRGGRPAPAADSGDGALEEPLQKGDMVVVRMRSAWELEGELRAINDEVVRVFDFAVCDVLRLRRKDIERIERLVDAD